MVCREDQRARFQEGMLRTPQENPLRGRLEPRKEGETYVVPRPRLTPNGSLYKGAAKKSIEFVENYLMSRALDENPGLLNKRDMGFWRETHIPGLLNSSGALQQSTRALATTLGMKKRTARRLRKR